MNPNPSPAVNSFIQALGNQAQNSQPYTRTNMSGVLNDMNPTSTLFCDYNPQSRAVAALGKNITTLDKTSGIPAQTPIMIHRGAPHSQRKINPGDFVTTNLQLAKDYAGTGRVLSARVPMSHVLDSIDEPLGEEYLYRPPV